MRKVILIFALLALSFCLEGIEELNDANFEQKVYSDNKFWLVAFTASWVHVRKYSVDIVNI